MTQPAPEGRSERHSRGTIPVTVTAAQAAAGSVLIAGPARLMGWSLASAAAAAAGQVMDAGQPAGVIGVAASSSDTQWFGEHGVYIGTSVAVLTSAGALSGVVYVRQLTDED